MVLLNLKWIYNVELKVKYVRMLDESIQTLTKIVEKNVLRYSVEENLLKLAC